MTNATNLFSPNDQADPQPGQRSLNIAENAPTPTDSKPEALTAVGSSDLFGVSLSLFRDNKTVGLFVPNGYVEMSKDLLISLGYAVSKTLLEMSQAEPQ